MQVDRRRRIDILGRAHSFRNNGSSDPLRFSFQGSLIPQLPGLHVELERLGIHARRRGTRTEFQRELLRDEPGDLFLDGENILGLARE